MFKCNASIDTQASFDELDYIDIAITIVHTIDPIELHVAKSSELVSSVQLPLKELELVLIPSLTDSCTGYTCDSSVCSICAYMNQFLTIDYTNCDTGSDMDVITELLELEYTNFIKVFNNNSALVSNVKQNSVQKEKTLLVVHVDNVAEGDTIFTSPSLRRRPPTYRNPLLR